MVFIPDPTWLEEALRKYRAKLDHVTLRPKISQLIPDIYDKTATAQAQNDRIIKKVNAILQTEGVLSDFHPYYYDYALALDRVQRVFEYFLEGNVEYCYDVRREYGILRDKWEGRGLNSAILDKIYVVVVYRCKYEVVDLWTLAEPIEQVILDNEEKSTTYNETGDTGLLLGIVKLPAPKNHLYAVFMATMSMDFKSDVVGTTIFRKAHYDKGVMFFEFDCVYESIETYRFTSDSGYEFGSIHLESQKGSTELELRIYLKGNVETPDVRVYCRNLVVTVIPFYKA